MQLKGTWGSWRVCIPALQGKGCWPCRGWAGVGAALGTQSSAPGWDSSSCQEPSSSVTSRTGQDSPEPRLGLWLAAPPVRIPGAGRVSWKEIKQVPKPAWQAVKILPGFCQFCRKCHTPPSIQAEINRKCFSLPVNIFEISEAFLIPSLKCKRENWDRPKKLG